MTEVTLSATATAAANKATLESAFAAAGAGGTVTITSSGTFLLSGVEMPAGLTLDCNSARFLSPVLTSGDGTPIIWIMGADCRITNGIFDGQRDKQPADGFSDSVDGGGLIKAGRAYRCAVRADSSSGVAGQADADNVQIDDCIFQRTFGAGFVARGATNVTFKDSWAIDTNFEAAHVSQGGSGSVITITGNRLVRVGSGHASTNADGFIVGQVGAGTLIFENNSATGVERALLKVSAGGTIKGNRLSKHAGAWRGNAAVVGTYPSIQVEVCDGLKVSDNYFYNVGHGVSVSNVAATDIDIDRNTIEISNGTSTPEGVLIQAGSSNIRVRDNVMTDIERHGVHASGYVAGLVISGNHIRGKAGSATGGVGIWLVSGNGEDFAAPKVINNDVAGFSGLGGAGSGIGIFPTGTGTFSDIVVTGNTLDATDSFEERGIFWHNAGDYVSGTVSGNTVTGILSTSVALTGLTVEDNTVIDI